MAVSGGVARGTVSPGIELLDCLMPSRACALSRNGELPDVRRGDRVQAGAARRREVQLRYCLTVRPGTGIIAVAKFRQWDWVTALSDVVILLHPDAVGVL
jgi:hypothetical protein